MAKRSMTDPGWIAPSARCVTVEPALQFGKVGVVAQFDECRLAYLGEVSGGELGEPDAQGLGRARARTVTLCIARELAVHG
ncbi:hypothetical protein [Streptomyces violascens]|uniref:hypothetical protein n=1 Tax=Streptomyces violascens TaxID=67381 RepID=UPI0036567C22